MEKKVGSKNFKNCQAGDSNPCPTECHAGCWLADIHAGGDGYSGAPLLERLDQLARAEIPTVEGAVEAARKNQRLGGEEVNLQGGLVAAFALEGITTVVENLKYTHK